MPTSIIYIQNYFEQSSQVNWKRNYKALRDFIPKKPQEAQTKQRISVGNVLEINQREKSQVFL